MAPSLPHLRKKDILYTVCLPLNLPIAAWEVRLRLNLGGARGFAANLQALTKVRGL